eukprot:scaffold34863_cov55-Attheya_sp.AAC.8
MVIRLYRGRERRVGLVKIDSLLSLIVAFVLAFLIIMRPLLCLSNVKRQTPTRTKGRCRVEHSSSSILDPFLPGHQSRCYVKQPYKLYQILIFHLVVMVLAWFVPVKFEPKLFEQF